MHHEHEDSDGLNDPDRNLELRVDFEKGDDPPESEQSDQFEHAEEAQVQRRVAEE